MKRSVKKMLCALLAVAVTAGATQLAACSGYEDSYTVTYDPNYTGAVIRTVSVQTGANAISWKPYRDGYFIDGWYIDKQCTRAFDFSAPIAFDVTLYANWTENPEMHRVVFDSNYTGAPAPTAVEVEHGRHIDASLVPEVKRLGFDFTGWYTDEECTQKWMVGYDAVTQATTLYAGYKYDNSIPRNAKGEPVYENVEVNVWRSVDYYTRDVFNAIVEDFNREYEGKIHVAANTSMYDQNTFSLRMQFNSGKNLSREYYGIGEIYDMAGLDYSASLWYEDSIRDCFVNGRQESIPLISSVPYIVYNKELMAKYNGDEPLPDSYTEFAALLKDAYDGEAAANPEFRSIVSDNGWTFRDAAMSAAFYQNGTSFYKYEDGVYSPSWYDDGERDIAIDSLKKLYEYFGVNGSLHGMLFDSSDYKAVHALNYVRDGNALLGLVNWCNASIDVVNTENSSVMGVMPISGLFSDKADTKDVIPVSTVGFAFYKSETLTNKELAAAAVFADYASKNSWRFAEKGYYPMCKASMESEGFTDSKSASAKRMIELLNSVCSPQKLITQYGSYNGQHIVRVDSGGTFIKPFLKEDSDANAAKTVDTLKHKIKKRLTT